MAAPLPTGMFNPPIGQLGAGPGHDFTPPVWSAFYLSPQPSNVAQIYNLTVQHNLTAFVNLPGNRNFYCDPGPPTPQSPNGTLIYNPQRYRERCERFAGNATVETALAERRWFPYIADEPNHFQFNGSISDADVNDMGLVHKLLWPGGGGCITTIRAAAQHLHPPTPYISDVTGEQEVGWTGVDYGWVQWNRAATQSGMTPRAFYNNERNKLLAIDLGMMASNNWVNGGDGRLWDFLNNGTSSGRIVGPQGSPLWLQSPAEIREQVDALWDDADLPVYFLYIMPPASNTDGFEQYELRSDFVAAFEYVINKCNSRPVFNGLRTPKGGTTPPPPPTGTKQRKHLWTGMGLGTRVGVRKAG